MAINYKKKKIEIICSALIKIKIIYREKLKNNKW